MKFCIVFLVFIAISFTSVSQTIPKNPNVTDAKGMRQEKWTLLFDANWTPVNDQSKASFYRLIEYKNDKPVGMVRDYYLTSGKVQWEGMLLQDRPEERKQGLSTWYRENGTKIQESLFKDGEEIKVVSFNWDGSEIIEDWVSLMKRGEAAYKAGKYADALEIFKKSVVQAQKQFGPVDLDYYVSSLQNLALTNKMLGFYDEVEKTLQEAIRIREKTVGKEHFAYARLLNNLATFYYDLGFFDKAEPLFLQAKSIHEKTTDKNNFGGYTESLINLASLYQRMGFYEKAEPLFLEAKSINEKMLGTNDPTYALSLDRLGSLYDDLGDPKKAEDLYLEAKAIRERTLGREHVNYALSLEALGRLYMDRNLFEKAEPLLLEGLALEGKTFGEVHRRYAISLNGLGDLYFRTERFEKSEQCYIQAKNIFESLFGKEHMSYALSLSNLSRMYISWGKFEKSKACFLESNAAVQNLIKRYFPQLSGKEREKFYSTVKSRCERFTSFSLALAKGMEELRGEVYDLQVANKALLFNADNQIRQRILSSKNDSLIRLYISWQEKRSALAKAYQMNTSDKSKAGINVSLLEEEINKEERKLSSLSGYGSELHKNSYSWKDVQSKLQKNEAAVELIRFRKTGIYAVVTDSSSATLRHYAIHGLTDTIYYAALIVTPQSKLPELVLLKNGKELESRYIKGYKNSIQFKLNDSSSYSQFWKPIAEIIRKNKKTKRIFISPDGVYNSINLITLQNPSTKKYVVDEFDIQVVTNTKDLVIRGKEIRKGSASNASLFGFPDYSGKQDTTKTIFDKERSVDLVTSSGIQRFFAGGKISRLPGTQKEIEAINKLLSDNQVKTIQYMEGHATEEGVKNLNDPQVLHIATHGFFLQDLKSADNRAFAGFDAQTVIENPLLRSGLLLAGSQQTIDGQYSLDAEDGILTAYEAMNLRLDGTELVVLSACETGVGEVKNGEGVYGLQRAFQTAGAKSVIMSLWKVDDNATQQLMTTFYSNWIKSGDKRDAFNKAQDEVRKKYQHTYYWGAFVLVGE